MDRYLGRRIPTASQGVLVDLSHFCPMFRCVLRWSSSGLGACWPRLGLTHSLGPRPQVCARGSAGFPRTWFRRWLIEGTLLRTTSSSSLVLTGHAGVQRVHCGTKGAHSTRTRRPDEGIGLEVAQ